MTPQDWELEQYRALRAEITRAMEDGNQVMSFGLAAVGIVLTAGLSVKGTRVGFAIFAFMVPCLSALVLSMWFAAQERIARASYFITGIEGRLRKALALETPMWDSWLRLPSKREKRTSRHFWNTEFSGMAIFVFLIFGPLILSSDVGSNAVSPRVKIITTVIAGLIYSLFLIWFRGRMRRWREWLSKTFGQLE